MLLSVMATPAVAVKEEEEEEEEEEEGDRRWPFHQLVEEN